MRSTTSTCTAPPPAPTTHPKRAPSARLFGATTPCSSTKGWTGHVLGASGIIEAVICWLALQHGFMPGSCHTLVKDPALGVNYLLDNRSERPARIMSNSFGFGGTNCSIVLGRA